MRRLGRTGTADGDARSDDTASLAAHGDSEEVTAAGVGDSAGLARRLASLSGMTAVSFDIVARTPESESKIRGIAGLSSVLSSAAIAAYAAAANAPVAAVSSQVGTVTVGGVTVDASPSVSPAAAPSGTSPSPTGTGSASAAASLSGGAIAGIVIGSLSVAALVGIGVFFYSNTRGSGASASGQSGATHSSDDGLAKPASAGAKPASALTSSNTTPTHIPAGYGLTPAARNVLV